MTKLLGVLLAALALLGVAAPGRAADPVTRTVKSVTDGVAAECRRLGWPPHDVCTAIGGVDVSEARMRAYEASWVHRALSLQRKLDDGAPFLRELVPHTHNSFNSSAYPPTLTQLDPNQLHSMRDQLRMDMRGLEMDIHNWPHLDNPRGDVNDVVLCHGEPTPVGPIVVHVGCSVDRPFTDGLAELRGWLDEPANAGEIVLLYLENNLDGDPAAHDKASTDLQTILGDLIYRPPATKPCAPMPMTLSRAAIRAAGKRILIVGNCGPGAWGTWVHERGPQWDESSSAAGDDYPDYPACLAERAARGYASHWIRRYEDSTFLTAIAGGGNGDVSVNDTRRMVRCGVNMPGFDQLYPDDPRLAQLVWSWAPNEPVAGAGSCAVQGPDARFHAASCAVSLPLACVSDARAWRVAATCPEGTHPGAPANGFENEQLREAKVAAGATTVRLAL